MYIKVFVSASFADKEALFSWLKKYGRHSDEHCIYIDEFAFTPYPSDDIDAILVFNTPSASITLSAQPKQVIAFMMEPGIKSEHPWMFQQLHQYASVYSPLPNSTNTVISHGYLGWYLSHDLASLEQLPLPQKTKPVSCIASGLKQLKGHRLRLRFVDMLKQQIPAIDFFGKGSHYLPEKIDGLLPYRYSIAIENASIPFYFTEKINDCFLAWTVPLYFGCLNIGRFFPEKSFIKIDIRDPEKGIRTIRDVIEADDWNSRIEYLREARELVLHKYQPLAGAAAILRDIPVSAKQPVTITPVQPVFLHRMKGVLQKFLKQ
jgi:hypothetical protein